MGEFWKSKSFKALLAVFIILSAFFIRGLAVGGMSVVMDSVLGFVLNPIQAVTAFVSEKTHTTFDKYFHVGDVYRENQELKNEVASLTKRLGDYEEMKNENENLKSYLDIKEINPDFSFEPARVIGRDPSDLFKSFIIGKGSLSGIKPRDVVITPMGLVGIVDEVSLSSSKVKTSLDISAEIGVSNTRTMEVGIVTGDASLASKGKCVLKYIPRSSSIVKGDIIFTTGVGGVFPEGLVVGRVDEIQMESHGKSLFASIIPPQNPDDIRDVFVIKSFVGKLDYTDISNYELGGYELEENEAEDEAEDIDEKGKESLPQEKKELEDEQQ